MNFLLNTLYVIDGPVLISAHLIWETKGKLMHLQLQKTSLAFKDVEV